MGRRARGRREAEALREMWAKPSLRRDGERGGGEHDADEMFEERREELGDVDGRGLEIGHWSGALSPPARRSIQKTVLGSWDSSRN